MGHLSPETTALYVLSLLTTWPENTNGCGFDEQPRCRRGIEADPDLLAEYEVGSTI